MEVNRIGRTQDYLTEVGDTIRLSNGTRKRQELGICCRLFVGEHMMNTR